MVQGLLFLQGMIHVDRLSQVPNREDFDLRLVDFGTVVPTVSAISF